MAGRSTTRWLLLAVGLVLALKAPAGAQEIVRLPARTPNNKKEIRLDADDIVEMRAGRWTYYRLLGGVQLIQGVTLAKGKQAIARLDAERFARDQVYELDLYLEEDIFIENGSLRKEGCARALVELGTQGALQLNAHKNKIVPQPLTADPLFARAARLFAASPEIVRTSADTPPDNIPPIGLPDAPSSPAPGASPPGLPAFPSVPPTQAPALVSPPISAAPLRQLRIGPRSGQRFEITTPEPNVIMLTGGVILTVNNVEHLGIVDLEADNVVIWTKGDTQQVLQNLQTTQGQTSRETEFYLSGNVVLRATAEGQDHVLRAEQIYYDVSRNVAVAVAGDLEFREKDIPEAVHFRADELFQLGPSEFRADRAEIFSSRLPSDPGLKLVIRSATVTQQRAQRRNILGRGFYDEKTGQPVIITERFFEGEDVAFEVAGVPILRLPFVQGNVNDPTGPLKNFGIGNDRVFGFQIWTEFDLFNLLGRTPPPGWTWTAALDYLFRRGPAGGTNFGYAGNDLFGFPGAYQGRTKLWGIYDQGSDIIGDFRNGYPHPLWRGRVFWQHMQDLPAGFQLQTQVSLLSDKNFHEQYYKMEFDRDLNQETFLYPTYQRGVFGASLLGEFWLRNWFTETAWLPKLEGRAIGWSFFDLLTYDVKASAGYAQLHATQQPYFAYLPTDVSTNTGRFDLWQDLSLPFALGAFKLVPYGVLDLTAYTNDLTGNSVGRLYGGGGLRASVAASRLFPEVESELFNLQGIYHKSVFSGNYYIASSNTPFSNLPQLDRLHNDATDQALRDIYPNQPIVNPANGTLLQTSPIFNPQLYAIRRLVESRVDTLDTIHVLQLDWRNRWQTKRGFPGMQHTVDYFTLDTSLSIFPNAARDNFGNTVGLIEYDAVWNVGDRTSLVSTGWFEPTSDGPHYFTLGANLNRPDRTNFFIGFRYTDPLQSRLLITSATYNFSPKYAMTSASMYDFGLNKGLSNAVIFTRNGTDVQLNISLTYNPLLNNFGFNIDVMPLVAVARRASGPFAGHNPMLGR